MTSTFKTSLTKVYSSLILTLLVLLILGCNAKNTTPATESGSGDLSSFTLEEIPGSSLKHAFRKSEANILQQEGYVENGKRTGQWIDYTPDGDLQYVRHYVNGMLEGVSVRMTFRNQADLRETYRQNVLHGPWTAYKFGRVLEQRTYVNGKIEGLVKNFDEQTFRLKQEAQYQNGQLHGYFRYYDDKGTLSLEYEYKNGEKVSGGIVEKK